MHSYIYMVLNLYMSFNALPSRRRCQVPLKLWYLSMKLRGVTSQNTAFLKFICLIISLYYYFIAFGTCSKFVNFWYDNLKIYTLLLLYKIKVNIFYYSSQQEWRGILVVLYSGCFVSHQHSTWHDHLGFQSDFQCLQILMNKYKIIINK